ncbi:MAG: hypothetical protein AAFY60_06060, partial [Myxococcota bacterium]
FVELLQQHLERRNGKPVDGLISVIDAEFCLVKTEDWPIVLGPVSDGAQHDPDRLSQIVADALDLKPARFLGPPGAQTSQPDEEPTRYE